jgi:hypothetical protein
VAEHQDRTRKLSVLAVRPKLVEYDRVVEVELWHNAYQTTALRLSTKEATDLMVQLAKYLTTKEAPRG